MFHDYQINSENTAFKGGIFKMFGKAGEPYMGGLFMREGWRGGGVDNLETMGLKSVEIF